MTSRETAKASADARIAAGKWRDHRTLCAVCALAAWERRWSDLCVTGQDIRRDHQDAADELKMNRELDKQPAPDQPPLF